MTPDSRIPTAADDARRPEAPPAAALKARGLWRDASRRLLRSPMAVICLSVIVVYVLVALSAPVVLADWAETYDYDNVNRPPSGRHPLGTDAFGQSVLGKTLLAAKVSLTVGLMANVIAIPLGMILGAVAGYYGGRTDDVIVSFYTTVAAIPGILRVIALKFAFLDRCLFEGTVFEIDLGGMAGLYLALGLMSWIGTCRLVRAETMKIRQLDYVLAAQAMGRRSFSILWRHVLPNVMHIGVISFSLGFVAAIMAEVVLSYLGLGVPVGTPSWGTMISASRMELVAGHWWELAAAVGAMFVLVLAINIFGDRLRDALDPKLRAA